LGKAYFRSRKGVTDKSELLGLKTTTKGGRVREGPFVPRFLCSGGAIHFGKYLFG